MCLLRLYPYVKIHKVCAVPSCSDGFHTAATMKAGFFVENLEVVLPH